MEKTDVLIVGAGPAGSVCGYLLQKAGIPTILIDHATFPRDKICGGGLSPNSWKLIEELIPGLKYEYNSIRKIKLQVDDSAHCEFESEGEFRLVKRKQFDNILLNAYIGLGGHFQKGAFGHYEEKDGSVIVTLKSGEQISCRYLVGADGSNSVVRRQLNGHRDERMLVMEQYVDKSPDNAIEVKLSHQYDFGGYFYRFPNGEFDAVGFGDASTTPERFREVLKDVKISETKLRGCYIYLKNDYPLHDHIILVGDAGGFANRVSYEGIKAAFITARHAAEAIKTGRPFREVNGALFKKMKQEDRFRKFFYSKFGIWVIGQLCRWPSIVKRCFDRVTCHR